jgi:uncharacterized RDD family membrane protein YckC
MEQQNQADLLQEIQEEINYVDPVSPGIRFVNYLVDQIVIAVLINAIKFGLAIISNGENYNDHLLLQENMTAVGMGFLLSLACSFTYYSVFEAASNGRTLGKILTNTIAVTQDGTPFTFKHALMRTLCRFIPFEPFSAFGYMPWHDSITKTVVTKKTW